MVRCFPCCASGEQDDEFLAANSKCFSTSGCTRQPGCNKPKYLVTGVVSIVVVDALEVIDVHDGYRERMTESEQGIVKCSTGVEPGEFVVIGKRIRILNDAA